MDSAYRTLRDPAREQRGPPRQRQDGRGLRCCRSVRLWRKGRRRNVQLPRALPGNERAHQEVRRRGGAHIERHLHRAVEDARRARRVVHPVQVPGAGRGPALPQFAFADHHGQRPALRPDQALRAQRPRLPGRVQEGGREGDGRRQDPRRHQSGVLRTLGPRGRADADQLQLVPQELLQAAAGDAALEPQARSRHLRDDQDGRHQRPRVPQGVQARARHPETGERDRAHDARPRDAALGPSLRPARRAALRHHHSPHQRAGGRDRKGGHRCDAPRYERGAEGRRGAARQDESGPTQD